MDSEIDYNKPPPPLPPPPFPSTPTRCLKSAADTELPPSSPITDEESNNISSSSRSPNSNSSWDIITPSSDPEQAAENIPLPDTDDFDEEDWEKYFDASGKKDVLEGLTEGEIEELKGRMEVKEMEDMNLKEEDKLGESWEANERLLTNLTQEQMGELHMALEAKGLLDIGVVGVEEDGGKPETTNTTEKPLFEENQEAENTPSSPGTDSGDKTSTSDAESTASTIKSPSTSSSGSETGAFKKAAEFFDKEECPITEQPELNNLVTAKEESDAESEQPELNKLERGHVGTTLNTVDGLCKRPEEGSWFWRKMDVGNLLVTETAMDVAEDSPPHPESEYDDMEKYINTPSSEAGGGDTDSRRSLSDIPEEDEEERLTPTETTPTEHSQSPTDKDKEIYRLRSRITEINKELAYTKTQLQETKDTVASKDRVIQRYNIKGDLEEDIKRLIKAAGGLAKIDRKSMQIEEENAKVRKENDMLKKELAKIMEEKGNWVDDAKSGLPLLLAGAVGKEVDYTPSKGLLETIYGQPLQRSGMECGPDDVGGIFWMDVVEPTTEGNILGYVLRFLAGEYDVSPILLSAVVHGKLDDDDTTTVNMLLHGIQRWLKHPHHSGIEPVSVLLGVLELRYDIPTSHFDDIVHLIAVNLHSRAVNLVRLLQLACIVTWRRIGKNGNSVYQTGNKGEHIRVVRRLFSGSPPEVHEVCENMEECLDTLGFSCDVDLSGLTNDGMLFEVTVPGGEVVVVDGYKRELKWEEDREVDATFMQDEMMEEDEEEEGGDVFVVAPERQGVTKEEVWDRGPWVMDFVGRMDEADILEDEEEGLQFVAF